MEPFLDSDTKHQVEHALSHLENPVKIIFFSGKQSCPDCAPQEQLLREFAALSPNLTLIVRDIEKHADAAKKLNIDKAPATAVVSEKDYGLRFYGLTSGHEFQSLLEAVIRVSTASTGLDKDLLTLVGLLDEPLHIEVMVTLTCPYCPQMVRIAQQMAMANPLIRADMVETSAFPELAKSYGVTTVPRTAINQTHFIDGAFPPVQAVLEVIKAVKPQIYKAIDEQLRKKRGELAVSKADPDHVYDVILVGGGPAALNALIYAARKNLDIALVAKDTGGQMHDTAMVENWLGVPAISGPDLTEKFMRHAQRHKSAWELDAQVTQVTKKGADFFIHIEGREKPLAAKSVIYCAGKHYRRLGALNEERFLGKGIAFCATCDAPLYRNRPVAVIGGGNSAFTAARDLLGFASSITIVDIAPNFSADPFLVDSVLKNPIVKTLKAHKVEEFLGSESLLGVRVSPVSQNRPVDIDAEGVFLEIGLVPNSGPVEKLLNLNPEKEIPVDQDNKTEVEGFFAAGDVTDQPVKQIITAAAAGARAALSAHEYLAGRDVKKT
ncbi:MAG: FAD-dependent oxidoreductase [Desulfatibacillaceae bacterium]|nr:FAD-dependent oxidoreductase [Desulfatibacillaceae bacterium]